MQHVPTSPSKHDGYATLSVALVILVAASLIGLYGARVGILEQRISSNEVRSMEGQSNAEAALEAGIMFLKNNRANVVSPTVNAATPDRSGWVSGDAAAPRWVECQAGDTALPCGDGTQNIFGPGVVHFQGANGSRIVNVLDDFAGTGSDLNDVYFVARCGLEPGDPCFDLNPTVAGTQPGPELNMLPITVISEGISLDQTARQRVQQTISLYPLFPNGPVGAPIIAAGTIGASGNFKVVANPNGGGPGVPISMWSNTNVSVASSSATCYLEEYLATGNKTDDIAVTAPGMDESETITLCPDCTCVNGAYGTLSEGGNDGLDILDVDGNVGENPDSAFFPSDMFAYVFGTPEANWQSVRDQAQVINGCASLGPTSRGLYWVEGDCAIAANTVVGSAQDPVVLILNQGALKMNGGSEIFGLVFSFDNPDVAGGIGELSVNGGCLVYGALLSNGSFNLSNGTFTVRFEEAVLRNALNGAAVRGLAKWPGSWANYF